MHRVLLRMRSRAKILVFVFFRTPGCLAGVKERPCNLDWHPGPWSLCHEVSYTIQTIQSKPILHIYIIIYIYIYLFRSIHIYIHTDRIKQMLSKHVIRLQILHVNIIHIYIHINTYQYISYMCAYVHINMLSATVVLPLSGQNFKCSHGLIFCRTLHHGAGP